MATKAQVITLVSLGRENGYRVKRTQNMLRHTPGSFLTKDEVRDMVTDPHIKVITVEK